MTEPDRAGLTLTTSCSCRACQVALGAMPSQRFICHCTICQGVYKAPYADATIALARDVEVLTPDVIEYNRHKAPPVLDRGTCRACGEPVVGFLKIPGLPQLAFLPTAVLPEGRSLPDASRHIHYAARTGDIADNLPKTNGELTSFLALTPAIVSVVLKG